MKRKDMIAVDTHIINRKIRELGLKNSYLAEKIGVDRKTISRWTTGKVKHIGMHNAKALCECIGISMEELADKKDIHVLGTELDRELAAEEIISENLLLLLSPSGSWRLIETIIKSTISPNLSKNKIGKLYNWLSITKWRRKEYDDATVFAEKAVEIGEQIGDKGIIGKGLFNLATISSITGDNSKALELYLKSYKMKECLEDNGDIASLCTNLSMVYRDMADFKESIHYQEEAVEIFSRENKSYNLSIAYLCMGYIYTEIGEFKRAIEYYNKSLKFAEESGYAGGLVTTKIYKLDAVVLEIGCEGLDKEYFLAIDEFLNGEYNDDFCYEYIARFLRIKGSYMESEKVMEIGFEKITHNPTATASLWHEKSRLQKAEKQFDKMKLCIEEGNEIYRRTGLIKRVISGDIKEYGKMI